MTGMFLLSLLTVFISLFTAAVGEALTYALVYRSEQYKRMKAEIDRQAKRLERKKDQGNEIERSNKRKLEKQEERLKVSNRDLSQFKMRSMFAIGLAFTALLTTFSSIFEGITIAKLPFEPIPFMRGISHRNLPGDNFKECSFIFLYVMSAMSIRQSLQKVLGFAPSRAMAKQSQVGFGALFQPPDQYR
ncbi:Transmembrane and coiled-coil domains protein 1 [Trichinella nativa]|uniref:Calcium load-activated calcium channel n=4 Tax=Trichinella TaxID=6333 RepID=A0A0V1L1X6_9BILA|nr:transmembrane and coiled-coil domain-containing protein 1 [Trichinella spiralis]KRX47103.1 Transmembrane and coiled-coil domains protein 1 [Trichinella murrelli]KRX55367.1 Transmembrane and coiled-coil domains protein 1 [Trichinella sp. T9]KRX84269.1 Transmembrane and coiled-coil domains protein 1 [Trichinella sp. T6]KRY55256.1 Transmembrane and coiled-coil domains protein 1 [Trichinella britovi]KRZ53531.1 Transmembrane and coiled-coil domains protein 1 [Trichinella nativa]KRZ90471.1 Trans